MAVTYHTAGRKRLLSYLREHADRQFTADELAEEMADASAGAARMGKSSVYRQLSRLCGEGRVSRCRSGDSAVCFYQYREREDCADHLHLKCLYCGRTQHLDCRAGEEILEHIRADHHFQVDGGRSVLFGCCESCAGKRTARGGPDRTDPESGASGEGTA